MNGAGPRIDRNDFALWELGFRPFFLLASIFAAPSIGLWALQFSGWLGRPYLQGPLWHAHEMLSGFTLRGHTGRALRADGADVACYLLVAAAAAVRVFVPIFDPSSTMTAVLVSAALWSSGFALFAVRYGPMLVRARIDGRPG